MFVHDLLCISPCIYYNYAYVVLIYCFRIQNLQVESRTIGPNFLGKIIHQEIQIFVQTKVI